MKNLLRILISFTAFCSCTTTKTDACKGPAKPDCMCTLQYQPVCGCDGKTYGNACEANCAGVKTTTPGECAK